MILVVDMNWKKDSLAYAEFVQPIVTTVKPLENCVVKHFSEVQHSELKGYSKIVLSGTALKDHATLSQTEKFHWLKSCEQPVLGICAGMQTISLVFGEPLKPCLQVGMTEIATLKENSLFEGNFKAYALHNFSVELSPNFDVLAKSTKCVQAVKHKRKDVYGVLFHPEVRNAEILQKFVKL
jgi:GMP synthase-like glutamine amidotransferase